MKTCLYCIEEIHDKAVVCPQCRRDQGLFAGWLRSPIFIIGFLYLVYLSAVYIDARILSASILQQFEQKSNSYLNEINKELEDLQ